MENIQSPAEDAVRVPRALAETHTTSFGRFTAWCVGVVAVGALSAMAFIAAVDPYHLTGWIDAEGFNHIKPLPEQYREQIKVAQARAAHPKAILLGNSRIEVGLDPDSGVLGTYSGPAYNLGLAGTGLSASKRAYERVRDAGAPPAMAIIGAEFRDFLVKADASSAAPASKNTQAWQWRVDTVFSLKSLLDAAHTLMIQKTPEVETMTARGHTPLREYNKFARQEGYHAIFQQRAQENAKGLVREPHDLIVKASGSSDSIDGLRDLLQMMAKDGTEVHLVIYPYHAQLMAMFGEAGLEGTMEDWKRMLVREIESLHARQPGARVSLWDFSGYGAVQCESIPAPNDTLSKTRWYWEAGHFKANVGDLMMRRVLGENVPLGVRLTAENLEQNRQRIANERAQCENANPGLFADARNMIAKARSQLK